MRSKSAGIRRGSRRRALRADGAEAGAPDRPMRVCLFTDTLGDVNGVCRFIQNVAHQANRRTLDLQVVTSTAFDTPRWDNIHNFEPICATRMPRYDQLEIVVPPFLRMLRFASKRRPDVIHISTPGPVGITGHVAARRLRVPIVGVYHTDFPAYVDHLFDDHAMTWIAGRYMRWFYGPFRGILTRSEHYMASLESLGIPPRRIARLLPGLDTSRFNPSHRDESIWARLASEGAEAFGAIDEPVAKVLYVGRVSVEKNLPLLTRIWPRVRARCADMGVRAGLVVVGDGPYRKGMQDALAGEEAFFLGFRHGRELSTIYASSDVFVFPSTTDTLGQVVLESQASGVPVVVSDVGGPSEVVEHGRTGFVVCAQRPNDWIERISLLACDKHSRTMMGAAGAETMGKCDIAHSFEHFWQVHENAWAESLAEQ